MKERGPAASRTSAGARTWRVTATALVTHSLLLFVTASVLQRLWVLANSDVVELSRRASESLRLPP